MLIGTSSASFAAVMPVTLFRLDGTKVEYSLGGEKYTGESAIREIAQRVGRDEHSLCFDGSLRYAELE